MKEYRSIVSFKLILYVFINPAFVVIPLLLLVWLISPEKLSFWTIHLIFAYLFFVLIHFLTYHNAFYRFAMDEKGVRNKYFSLNWNDVIDYKIIEMIINKYRGYPKIQISIICIGEIRKDSFFKLDPKKCVFFECTRKNREILEMFMNTEKGRET